MQFMNLYILNKILIYDTHNYTLPLVAGGEGDITWQKDGEDAEDDQVEKVDETSSKLLIRNAKIEDTGRYTCFCEFDTGHRDDISYTIFVYGKMFKVKLFTWLI